MKNKYFETILFMQRLDFLFLRVMEHELKKLDIQDMTSIQCLILYNLGKGKLNITEIMNRGYYLGSNVSYNLKKMIQNNYLIQEPSPHDKRSTTVCLSEKGLKLYQKIGSILGDQALALEEGHICDQDLHTILEGLQRVEQFWLALLNRR
jgi:DNA-binding MarR family transcriptional regulator